MKIFVLGAGAIGSLFGGLLTEGGEDVTLIDRSVERVKLVNREGLRIKGVSGERHIRVRLVSYPPKLEPPDLLLLAVKSYDTVQAVSGIRSIISGDTCVLTIQNGLGNVERIRSLLGSRYILPGSTMQASTLIQAGVIYHAAMGITYVGEMNGGISQRALRVAKVFNNCGIETKISPNILGVIWSKVLINTGINALTALTGLRNGGLLKVPGLTQIMSEAVLEGFEVAKRLNVKLEFEDPVRSTVEVAERTGNNRSSMLQDIKRGSPTEIDFINGAIAELGDALGIPTPINRTLTSLVKGLELARRESNLQESVVTPILTK